MQKQSRKYFQWRQNSYLNNTPMKKQEITVDRGKKIFVFDNVFEASFRASLYQFAMETEYKIGWNDTNDIENKEHCYFHSKVSLHKFEELKLYETLKKSEVYPLITHKFPYNFIINCSHPSDTNFAHTHVNTTLLYYANSSWKPEWAGETLFFNEEMTEVLFTSVYKPGRIILFDGGIPHTIRSQSRYGPQYRFTYTVFFDENEGLTDRLSNLSQ